MTSRTPTTDSLGALPSDSTTTSSVRGDVMRRLSRGSWIIAGVVLALLLIVAGRYGFHRDELYFIEGGHHLSWAQPDNPITVPLVAAAWHSLVGGQLVLFRIVPAVLAAACVLIAAATARLLGGSALHQTLTAGLMASTSILLATGHLFSTTTFDLFLTSTVIMLLIRALQEPAELRRWVAVGVIAGLALEIKILPAMILASCLAGIVIMGPRHVLRRQGPWLAMLIAAVIAAPNVIWQTVHGWPMLEVAGNIAAGGSTSSSDRYLVLPMHLLMAGPAAAIVIIIGLIATVRSPALRPHRWIPVAYLVMLVLVVATGAKPYYLAGFFAAMIALGVGPLITYLARQRWRWVVAATLAVVLVVPTVIFALPIAPVGSPVFQVAVSVNPDQAETVGWDQWVRAVQRAAVGTDAAATVVITRNYGEAGALSRERRLNPESGLPPIYSGHNAYAAWGPPPEAASSAIVVGRFSDDELAEWFAQCALVERFGSPPGVDNEEDGAPIRVCQDRQRSWSEIWPQIARIG
jgi:4-amino-4-deoxy-L-arabinose transferase-like glycosyltransferase